jgi:hypothetical protein
MYNEGFVRAEVKVAKDQLVLAGCLDQDVRM